jgi:hypothetical protein
LNFSQEIFTRDRLAEESTYNKETVRLNLLQDKLVRGLEMTAKERDELQQTKIRLTAVCVQESARIDELETDNTQLLNLVQQNNQLIAHLQARPIHPMNINGTYAIAHSPNSSATPLPPHICPNAAASDTSNLQPRPAHPPPRTHRRHRHRRRHRRPCCSRRRPPPGKAAPPPPPPPIRAYTFVNAGPEANDFPSVSKKERPPPKTTIREREREIRGAARRALVAALVVGVVLLLLVGVVGFRRRRCATRRRTRRGCGRTWRTSGT